MIIVPLKEGENIERALKRFKKIRENRCYPRTSCESELCKAICQEKRAASEGYLRTASAA